MADYHGMVKVIEGEASESDEENEEEVVGEDDKMNRETPPTSFGSDPQSKPETYVSPANQQSPVTAPEVSRQLSEQKQSGGLLVSGEASESEEEEEQRDKGLPVDLHSSPLELQQPLKVLTSPTVASSMITSPPLSTQPSTPDRLLRLDSLLHKKLKETNDRLKSHIEVFKSKQLENATKDLKNISQQLSRSQAVIKEISNGLRMTTNELFHVEDKLDIIASCTLIPYINITPHQNVKPPSPKSPATQGSSIAT